MDELAEVNRMSDAGHSDFAVLTRDDERMVLIGGFDLDYYHDVQVTFHGVVSTECPEFLYTPHFHDAGAEGEHRHFVVRDEEGEYHVVARGVDVQRGKVFHYDRGNLLRPGERIAPWVRRGAE
ncbi:MAG TPA: hypothetical protein VF665_22345 [Longimicrobium sp.]|jgi:hypothetical protein|uniref:hypothetical protein n=1 Tax=Longimicrobium sp. TaxID=2029185 RepID=UPI002ED897A1